CRREQRRKRTRRLRAAPLPRAVRRRQARANKWAPEQRRPARVPEQRPAHVRRLIPAAPGQQPLLKLSCSPPVTKVLLRREREREGQRSTGNIGPSSGRDDF